jgi:HD-GYP domain-containing protein (c-di-GMP phosphodiesterase class II)
MDSIAVKIVKLHNELRNRFPHLSRMAIAIYDKDSDLLKTFVDSTLGHTPINHYSVPLSQVPSLQTLAEYGQHRVIEDLDVLRGSPSAHSRWLIEQGFRSSYTLPLIAEHLLAGFLFFDADKPKYFDRLIIQSLNVYADLITSVLVNELAPLYTLRGAINAAQRLTHHRDSETAAHLIRMAQYSYLLAQRVSTMHGLSDECIEYILEYSPLHDIGKIGIPDNILLKPGKLTSDEYDIIKTHVQIGVDVINVLVKDFSLRRFSHLSILQNIIGCHHERYDGSGYPNGLKGDEIPVEGRIVAIADVLDALSHTRPYKPAFSFRQSVDYILDKSATLFDPVLCDALRDHYDEFNKIYAMFKEEEDGPSSSTDQA